MSVCPCHGEPWAQSGPKRTCRVKLSETKRRYRQSAKGKAAKKRWKAKYPEKVSAAAKRNYLRKQKGGDGGVD